MNPVINWPNRDAEGFGVWETDAADVVQKIVIGPSPGTDGEGDGIEFEFPSNLDLSKFTKLTHLYLWKVNGLKSLPKLPDGLKCLDVRDCAELRTVPNLPTAIDTLVLKDCAMVRALPIPSLVVFEKLEDVSLEGCRMLEESAINSLLVAAPNVRNFDASDCQKLRKIAPVAAEGNLLGWPGSLVDLRLNDCALLKAIPARWPDKLRRLGLRKAASLPAVPPLPASIDYVDLAFTKSLRFVPVFAGRPRTLFLHGSGVRLDPALLGEDETTNVAREVLADAAEGRLGRSADNEIKVILLGNGRCGKSSLARRWIEGRFDPEEKSTHGVRHWTKRVSFTPVDAADGTPEEARLNIWDFAGQDLYHNTHRLFLQSRAIFVLCWTNHGPGSDTRTDSEERAREVDEDLLRSLDYWRAQVAALGNMPGLNRPPPFIVVRTKRDRDVGIEGNAETELATNRSTGEIEFSAMNGDGLSEFEHRIEELTAEMLGVWERRSLPVRAMMVKAKLQLLKDSNDSAFLESERLKHLVLSPHATMERSAFDALVRECCPEGDYHDDPTLLLFRLHTNGFLFYDAEHLADDVILDQRWAVEGIYAFSARESEWHILNRLGYSGGEFTLSELARYSWGPAGYTPTQQAMLLRFMLSCGMCFELMQANEAQRGETVYAAPGFFPTRSSRLRRFPEIVNGPAAPWAYRAVSDVSESEMLALLSWIGTHWRRIAEKWRWGAMFEAADSAARVVMDWQRAERGDYAGTLRVWFDGAVDREFEMLVRGAVFEALNRPTSELVNNFGQQWPESNVEQKRSQHAAEVSLAGAVLPGTSERRMFPPNSQSLGLTIAFSFAGSDSANPFTAEIPATLARRLVERHKSDKHVKVLFYNLPEGEERLAEFTRNLAEGDLTIVFWSRRYFYSEYCMTEMMLIYQRPPATRLPEKRVLIYMLDGARLSKSGEIKATKWDEEWDIAANKRHDEAVKAAAVTTFPERLLREKTKHLKRDGIVQLWYDFIADGPAFEQFLAALKGYRIGRFVARPNSIIEAEASATELEAEVADFLKAPATMIELASQRLESGRKDDAVRLLLHAIACAPDAGHQAIEAWLNKPGNHAIPEALIAAAKEVIGGNNSPDA